ncbi:hypothetical protein [Maritimibacter sp. DP1N21-5]|uniref:hypothetical protein n=1 Tax=Maritimibacter sp. DP1N21-5 TaxID=2836867 RepID=UPI001C448A12|nr:hypothetical protein [Maritimibacter sp. DP1N21-5]MBV7408655.1 hypothetical protein [Maritimibacter sp. DP1N21-5]
MITRQCPFRLVVACAIGLGVGPAMADCAEHLRAQGVEEIPSGTVQAQGLAHLDDEGFDVFRMIESADGSIVFHASSGAFGRVLVLDASGAVISDNLFRTDGVSDNTFAQI